MNFSTMNSLSETLRAFLLVVTAWMLLMFGAVSSEAAVAAATLPAMTAASGIAAPAAPAGQGAALMVAAYGFLILLRRRGPRLGNQKSTLEAPRR